MERNYHLEIITDGIQTFVKLDGKYLKCLQKLKFNALSYETTTTCEINFIPLTGMEYDTAIDILISKMENKLEISTNGMTSGTIIKFNGKILSLYEFSLEADINKVNVNAKAVKDYDNQLSLKFKDLKNLV